MAKFKVEITDVFEARGHRAAATVMIKSLRDTSAKGPSDWRVRVTDLQTDDAYDLYFDKNNKVIGEDLVDPLDC